MKYFKEQDYCLVSFANVDPQDTDQEETEGVSILLNERKQLVGFIFQNASSLLSKEEKDDEDLFWEKYEHIGKPLSKEDEELLLWPC